MSVGILHVPSASFYSSQLMASFVPFLPFLSLPDHFEVNPRYHIISSVCILVYISERHTVYLNITTHKKINITTIRLHLKINNFKLLDIQAVFRLHLFLKIHNSFLNIRVLALDFWYSLTKNLFLKFLGISGLVSKTCFEYLWR